MVERAGQGLRVASRLAGAARGALVAARIGNSGGAR